jgi:hypothetical protein
MGPPAQSPAGREAERTFSIVSESRYERISSIGYRVTSVTCWRCERRLRRSAGSHRAASGQTPEDRVTGDAQIVDTANLEPTDDGGVSHNPTFAVWV